MASRAAHRPRTPDPMPIGTNAMSISRHGIQQFPRIGSRPCHQPLMERGHIVMSLRVRPALRFPPRLFEISAVLHQARALRLHREILGRAVAARHVHHSLHPFPPRRERHTLPVISARGRHRHSGRCARFAQAPEIDQRAAVLKAPIGVWFSCFSHTSVPTRSHTSGHRYCGVGGIASYTIRRAFSISCLDGSVM